MPWFKGRKFSHPVNAWVALESGASVRDVLQRKLLGTPGDAETVNGGSVMAGVSAAVAARASVRAQVSFVQARGTASRRRELRRCSW
jgi:hypothetical protein